MSTDACIKLAFKKLVTEHSYNAVTIKKLCKEAAVSRSTFYSYFKSKEDLTSILVFEEVLKPVHDIRMVVPTKQIQSAPQIINTRMYQSILENKTFFEQVVSHCPDIFLDTLIQGLSDINAEILKNTEIPNREKEYRAYYYASAQVMYMFKWIKDGMIVEPAVLAHWVYDWGGGYWNMASAH